MQLRDHPLMSTHTIPTWPPVWSNTSRGGGSDTAATGEMGILKKCLRNSHVKELYFLFIEYNGDSYVGALVVDNAAFCNHVASILEQNVGKSIKEIGDLDLAHTL